MKDLVVIGNHAINPEGVDYIEHARDESARLVTRIYFRSGKNEDFYHPKFDAVVKEFKNCIKKTKKGK